MTKQLTLLSCILVSFSCTRAPHSQDKENPDQGRIEVFPKSSPLPTPTAPPVVAPKTESIYALKLQLRDAQGVVVPLAVFQGHLVLVSMFYASCPSACPTLVRDIRALVQKLPSHTAENLRVLLVSFDPERDTPAALQALMEKHQLDPERWKLASAPEGQARTLAAVLGIQYRALPGDEYSHSSKVILLDQNGAIQAELEGLKSPPDTLITKLESLSNLKDAPSPSTPSPEHKHQ